MKKRLIATLSILAVFAFAIAAFAYTQNTTAVADKQSCCKSKDSCPMIAASMKKARPAIAAAIRAR